MTIETEFQLGEIVWFMLENKPIDMEIIGIKGYFERAFGIEDISIIYVFAGGMIEVNEMKCYLRKEGLLESIK